MRFIISDDINSRLLAIAKCLIPQCFIYIVYTHKEYLQNTNESCIK